MYVYVCVCMCMCVCVYVCMCVQANRDNKPPGSDQNRFLSKERGSGWITRETPVFAKCTFLVAMEIGEGDFSLIIASLRFLNTWVNTISHKKTNLTSGSEWKQMEASGTAG
jgi:hypothetical protein